MAMKYQKGTVYPRGRKVNVVRQVHNVPAQ
jgi:hypothetical protein